MFASAPGRDMRDPIGRRRPPVRSLPYTLLLGLLLLGQLPESAGQAEPPDSERSLEWARHELERGNPVQALLVLRDHLTSDPRSHAAYFYLGDAYAALGRHEKALGYVNRARELAPADSRYDSRAAVLEAQRGRHAFFLALFRFSRAVAGTSATDRYAIWRELAAMRRALARWDAAIGGIEQRAAGRPEDSHAHLALGEVYLERLRLTDALQALDHAVELDPERADVHVLRGLAHATAGRHELAAAAFGDAASLGPESTTALYGRAQALLALGRLEEARSALQAYSAFERDQQMDATNRSVLPPRQRSPFRTVQAPALMLRRSGTGPEFVPALYLDGFRLLERGEYQDGLRSLAEAASRDPLSAAGPASADDPSESLREIQAKLASGQGDATLHNDLGEVYFVLGRIDEAHDAFTHAHALDKKLPGPQLNLARVALDRRELQAALSHLRGAVDAEPPSSEAHRMLALALQAEGKRAERIAEFERAIQVNPRDERLRLALVQALLAAGRWERARATLTEAVATFPHSGQAAYTLAKASADGTETERTLSLGRTALTLGPARGAAAIHAQFGKLYSMLHRGEEAISAYYEAIGIAPNVVDHHFEAGNVLLRQNRLDEALAEFSAAAAIAPRDSVNFEKIAQIHLRTRRYSDAVAASRQSLARNPDSKARYILSRALLSLGEIEAGKAELEMFQAWQKRDEATEHGSRGLSALVRETLEAMETNDEEKMRSLLLNSRAHAPENKDSLEYALFHYELGGMLMKAGLYEQAIESLNEADRSGYDFPDTRRRLTEARARLAKQGAE